MTQHSGGARKNGGESADFRRLAAQLGISTRVLMDEEGAASTTATGRRESVSAAVTTRDRRARHNQNADEAKAEDINEATLQHVNSDLGADEEDDELEESLDQYQYDSLEIPDSLVLASDSNSLSASESISSELSLPRSFGQYDAIQPGNAAGGRRKPFSGISQFDDHLMHFPTGPAAQSARREKGSGSALAADRAGVALARIQDASGNGGGSDMMKKFYEVQVEKIRSQLMLATQAQRQLEKTLQAERMSWQERLVAMEVLLCVYSLVRTVYLCESLMNNVGVCACLSVLIRKSSRPRRAGSRRRT